ncbi:MAG: cytochrome c [Parvularculaceae bacterium]|uniref:c-type cytochrome n=1 Tax=Methylocystis sp. TaxID=1911079 RepID=UPI003D0CF0AD
MRGLLAMLAVGLAGCSEQTAAPASEDQTHGVERVVHELNSAAGRGLFVEKGCVVCHAVNGVGGKAAPALDAEIGAPPIDPLDFAARMWRGAPAMIELQSIELGYTIYLTADEIANLAAFAGDVVEQKKLVVDDVPEPMRGSFLDERFWEVEDWDEFLRNGQEGYEPAPPADEVLPEAPAQP